MPHTPEEMEADLEELQEEVALLKRSLRKGRAFTNNPLTLSTDLDDLGSVKTYLTIEKPDQAPGTPPTDVYYLYGYRTRRMQMTTTQLISNAARYPDGSTTGLSWAVRMPADWVVDTDVSLQIQLSPGANGVAVLRSYITAWADGETQVMYNIENAGIDDLTGTLNVLDVKTRTITGTDLQVGDAVQWLLLRLGGAGADTMAGNLDAFYGAWMEYTAFF